MAVTLLYRTGAKASLSGVGIDTLTLDASIRETHSSKVTVTTHPVEQGVKISDHRLREPDGLVLEGLITNDVIPDGTGSGTPSTFVDPRGGTLHYNARSEFDPQRAGKAYQTLLALLNSSDLLAVVTAVRSYENLTMVDLQVPRDQHSGQALQFTATFAEIRIVQNQQVQIQAKTTRASGNQNLHKKVTPPASDAQKKKSILKSVVDSQFGQHPLDTITNLFSSTPKVGF